MVINTISRYSLLKKSVLLRGHTPGSSGNFVASIFFSKLRYYIKENSFSVKRCINVSIEDQSSRFFKIESNGGVSAEGMFSPTVLATTRFPRCYLRDAKSYASFHNNQLVFDNGKAGVLLSLKDASTKAKADESIGIQQELSAKYLKDGQLSQNDQVIASNEYLNTNFLFNGVVYPAVDGILPEVFGHVVRGRMPNLIIPADLEIFPSKSGCDDYLGYMGLASRNVNSKRLIYVGAPKKKQVSELKSIEKETDSIFRKNFGDFKSSNGVLVDVKMDRGQIRDEVAAQFGISRFKSNLRLLDSNGILSTKGTYLNELADELAAYTIQNVFTKAITNENQPEVQAFVANKDLNLFKSQHLSFVGPKDLDRVKELTNKRLLKFLLKHKYGIDYISCDNEKLLKGNSLSLQKIEYMRLGGGRYRMALALKVEGALGDEIYRNSINPDLSLDVIQDTCNLDNLERLNDLQQIDDGQSFIDDVLKLKK